MNQTTIGLGGGCHWCTEAVFSALQGVCIVEQGYIKSSPPADSFSEAVQLTFDPGRIPEIALIEVHLRTHASTSKHSFRDKYRSAVYVYNEAQQVRVSAALNVLQKEFPAKLVTQVLPFEEFRSSDERYHGFYEKRVSQQFCTRYIDPKLDMLRARYRDLLLPDWKCDSDPRQSLEQVPVQAGAVWKA